MKKWPIGRKFLFASSIAFIISGGFNFGFSRFWPSLPFIVLALWISSKSFKSATLTITALLLTTFSIAVNLTLEKNPFVFPVLNGGEINIEKDGYLVIYSDGSGGFREKMELEEDKNSIGHGDTKYIKLSKGQKLRIMGIHVRHPDFGTEISLVTDKGRFSEWNYAEDGDISTNRPVKNPLLANLGFLMNYPILPLIVLSFLQRGFS